MELKQVEDRKHFTISFLPKKKPIFLEGGVKTFSRYKTDFKKALLFLKINHTIADICWIYITKFYNIIN